MGPTGQFLPPLKSSTKTAPAAKKTETKKRILQAVVVTVKVNNDSWNWWVKNSKVTSTERFTASDKCLASAGIQGLLNNWVFKNRNASFNAFNVMYKSLNTAFKVLGNAKATYKWTKFVGQKLLRKQKGKIATKLTVKTSIKAKKSTKAKTATKAKLGAFLPKLKASGKASVKVSGKTSAKASTKASTKTATKCVLSSGDCGPKHSGKVCKVGFCVPSQGNGICLIHPMYEAKSLKAFNSGACDKKSAKATKKRRAQGVATTPPAATTTPATGTATIKVSTNGVGLASNANTFTAASDNEFQGNGQGELAGNLLKVFSTLALALLVLIA